MVVFDAAGKSVAAVTHERADVGFFAIAPVHGTWPRSTIPKC